MKPKFGDIVINHYAGEGNPNKEGIFIREKSKGYEMTDGKGKFWLTHKEHDKQTIIGNVLKG